MTSAVTTLPVASADNLQFWEQPPVENIIVAGGETAFMTETDFHRLLEYPHSVPSGVWHGKMWRCEVEGLGWWLFWFEEEGEHILRKHLPIRILKSPEAVHDLLQVC